MLKYIKRAGEFVGTMVLFIGAVLVSTAINAAINALGLWIVLEQFAYSLPGGFWSYVIAGWGLAIILEPLTSNDR